MMRESKLKYFYNTLNTNMHPSGMQDMEAKDIPTTRFYEFLEAQNQAPYPYDDSQYPSKHPGHHSSDTYHLSAPYDPGYLSHAKSEPEPPHLPIQK